MNAAPGGNARAEAARALAAIIRRGRSLRELLPLADQRLDDARDRSLLRALLHAALRSCFRQRALLGLMLVKPIAEHSGEVEAVLLVALAQIEAGIGPDYAAVSGAVDAVKALGQARYAGLVNALLRRALREREALLVALPESLEVRHNHPRWLIETLQRDWPEHWRAILDGGGDEAPLWVRVRGDSPGRAHCVQSLAGAGIEAQAPAELPDAICVLHERGALPPDCAAHCSNQDGAAQLAVELMALAPGLRVLDACAAPGGKSMHLLEREPGVVLTALDADAGRAKALAERLRAGGYELDVRHADATRPALWWDGQSYDRILLDAPCSATGVIRRHPEIRLLRRAADVPAEVAKQATLLGAMLPLLAPGGRLVYATCSVLRDENDRQLERWLAHTPDALVADVVPSWFGLALPVGRQNLPGMGGMDGFYYAVVDKRR